VIISINQLKSGLTILVEGAVYQIVEFQHVKPGKGAAFVRTKLRNLENGYILERTFRGDEKIEEAFIEERKLQYLYQANEMYNFMAQDNYEEVVLSKEVLGNNIKFLKDNLQAIAYFYQGRALNVSLPNFVDYKIVHTEPGIKGDTARAGTKSAEIESGASIQVPLFIDTGDTIKVDTRTGVYIERSGP
jgi:elongation factor P